MSRHSRKKTDEPKHVVGIRDVAAYAGVSPMTVSRVIRSPECVATETRRRVEWALRELDYSPNELVRRLFAGKADTVLFVVPESFQGYGWFIGEVLRGVVGVLTDCGIDLLLRHNVASLPLAHFLAPLRKGVADGLILFSPLEGDSSLTPELLARFPVLVLCGHLECDGLDCIKLDNAEGMRLALDYLIRLGHRRIGLIAGRPDQLDGPEREQAFRRLAPPMGIPVCDELIRRGHFHKPGGESAMEQLLAMADPPTAVIASNDLMAFGALAAIQRRGLAAPDDVSVIGFDDDPACEMVTPNLTTIAQPLPDMGRIGALGILRRIDSIATTGAAATPCEVQLIKPTLRERASCAPPRGQKPRGRSPRARRLQG